MPYRNSKLTHLLKDSLGGTALTVMLCTVSPHLGWQERPGAVPTAALTLGGCTRLRGTHTGLQHAARVVRDQSAVPVRQAGATSQLLASQAAPRHDHRDAQHAPLRLARPLRCQPRLAAGGARAAQQH
mgnify:CR=1 FL=1